jgi:integrase
VFASSTSASGYISEPARLNARVCELAGIPHVSPHGLRRSFGSLAEWVECPDGIVKQIQGHVPGDVANKHYRVRPIDLLRLWHAKIEAWILEQAGIEQPAIERTLTGLRVVKAGGRN